MSPVPDPHDALIDAMRSDGLSALLNHKFCFLQRVINHLYGGDVCAGEHDGLSYTKAASMYEKNRGRIVFLYHAGLLDDIILFPHISVGKLRADINPKEVPDAEQK